MPDYLVATLAGAMGSFGDLAGHERRGSGLEPGRGAILGLIGAAFGIRRDDDSGQEALSVWQMAVGTLSLGGPLRDFHTAQPVPTARIRRPGSRRRALAALAAGDNTILTLRDYRTDCAFALALWGGDLGALEAALRRPVFTPYLGRKSCPLTMPMVPHRVSAETPVLALEQAKRPLWLGDVRISAIVSDAYPGVTGAQEMRWDDPQSRSGWTFGARMVHRPDPSPVPAPDPATEAKP